MTFWADFSSRPPGIFLLFFFFAGVLGAQDSPPLSGEVGWFISSAAGLAQREIPSYRSEEFPWVLRVTSEAPSGEDQAYRRREELFHEGELSQVRDFLISPQGHIQEETLSRGGQRLMRSFYDAAGRLIAEEFFRSNLLDETRNYFYREGQVQRMVRQLYSAGDPGPSQDWSPLRDSEGRLVRQGGETTVYHWLWDRDGFLRRTSMGVGETVTFRLFDSQGRITRQGEVSEGQSREEEFSYDEEGARVHRVEDPVTGETRETQYNDADEPLTVRIYQDKTLIQEDFYRWDEGNLLYRKSIKGYEKEEWFREFSPAGDLEKVQYYLNGKLVSQTDIIDETEADEVETMFHEGEPVLKIYRKDDQLRMEEFYSRGEMIRRRVYDDTSGVNW